MSTTPQENLFSPFKQRIGGFFGLNVQDGMVVDYPEDGKDWNEFRLEYQDDELWELTVREHYAAPAFEEILYYGKIPSREFFLALMANIKGAPPIDWTKS